MSHMVIDLYKISKNITDVQREHGDIVDKWRRFRDLEDIYNDLGEGNEVVESWVHLDDILEALEEIRKLADNLENCIGILKTGGVYAVAKEKMRQSSSEEDPE